MGFKKPCNTHALHAPGNIAERHFFPGNDIIATLYHTPSSFEKKRSYYREASPA
jgi:hypothetical protein